MRLIAFIGATCLEMQIGRVYVRALRPKYWFIPYRHFATNKIVFPSIIKFGLESE